MKRATRKTSAERQKEIVLAVLRIIGEQGVTSLTTNTIAKEVGISSGAIFKHFQTLPDILRGVVAYAVEKIEETFPDKSLPPLERLRLLATKRVLLFQSSPGLAWLLRSEQAYLTLPKDSLKYLQEIAKKSRLYLLDLLEEGIGLGLIRNDIDPKILLIPIMGTIHSMIEIPGGRKKPGYSKTEFEQVLLALELMLKAPDNFNKKENTNVN